MISLPRFTWSTENRQQNNDLNKLVAALERRFTDHQTLIEKQTTAMTAQAKLIETLQTQIAALNAASKSK